MAGKEEERLRLLGLLGEDVVTVFPRLQREVTVPHKDLIHITHSEADLLRMVVLDPGSSVTQIAQSIGQHRSNTSMRIAKLVEKGLLEKRADDGDGREVRIYPTGQARANLAGFQEVWARVLAEGSTASADELAVAERVMTELAGHLATWRAAAESAEREARRA